MGWWTLDEPVLGGCQRRRIWEEKNVFLQYTQYNCRYGPGLLDLSSQEKGLPDFLSERDDEFSKEVVIPDPAVVDAVSLQVVRGVLGILSSPRALLHSILATN